MKPKRLEMDFSYVNSVFEMTRKVVRTSRLAASIGRWSSERIVCQAVEGIAGNELFEMLAGGLFAKAHTEAQNTEEALCAGQLASSLAGLLFNVGCSVKDDLSYQVASLVYGMSQNDNSGVRYISGELPA